MAIPKTTIEQWAVLAAVVDKGGFAQAAAALHRSQPAASYAAARLQEALDLPLLAIEGRKSVLTPHGHTLLRRARVLLRELENLELLARVLKQGCESELRLVVDTAFPRDRLLKIVAELQKLCPNTQLRLADAVLSGAEEAITDGSADIVIATRVPPGFLGDSLLDVTFSPVAHPDHPLFKLGSDLTMEALFRYPEVVICDSGTKRPRNEISGGASVRHTVSSMEVALDTVLAGIAYAWLPEHLVEKPLRAGTLRMLPLLAGGTRKVPLHLVLVHPDHAGPAARAAVQCFATAQSMGLTTITSTRRSLSFPDNQMMLTPLSIGNAQ